jgi:pSer/pThr/pTyr-binding forkhead associated (FHA) protein
MNDMFYISFEEATTVKVGRLIENGVILEEQSVSRNHASIELKSEEMILKDDKSKYGTLIYEENAEIIIKA